VFRNGVIALGPNDSEARVPAGCQDDTRALTRLAADGAWRDNEPPRLQPGSIA
jgi:hypothetical protein